MGKLWVLLCNEILHSNKKKEQITPTQNVTCLSYYIE